MSLEHSTNFNRVQDLLILRSSSAVIQKTDKVQLVNRGRCVNGSHKAGRKLCNVVM